MTPAYLDTVRLLLEVAPAVFASGRFAMKGGTALNLFVQEMPRLSVDIDVVFVDHDVGRETALALLAEELSAAKASIEAASAGTIRAMLPANADGDEVKLLVANDRSQVKVEINTVFRGTVLAAEPRSLVPSAQELFTTDLRVPMLAVPELDGSKLVAAMDRQHPRDVFDVLHMLGRFGWQEPFVDCFVAYLAGHNRPIHEVLFPRIKPLEPFFTNDFAGMTRDDVSLDELRHVQAELVQELPRRLTRKHREFLLSLVGLEPDWELMSVSHLRALPAVKWKLLNLEKLRQANRQRFEAQRYELEQRFAALV